MKTLKVLAFASLLASAFLASSCNTLPSYEDQKRANDRRSRREAAVKDDWTQRTEAFKNQMRAQAAAAPLKTTATLLRGGKSTPLDFAKGGAALLKDYDVVALEEGRYEGFGDLVATGVRFVGKGRRKTWVAGRRGSPITVDAADFWDVSIVDGDFVAPGHTGLWVTHGDLIGEIDIRSSAEVGTPPWPLATVWTNLSAADFPRGKEGHQHLMSADARLDGKEGYNERDIHGSPFPPFGAANWPQDHYKVAGSLAFALHQSKGEVVFGQYTLERFDQKWPKLWDEAQRLLYGGKTARVRYKALLARMVYYVHATGRVTLPVDEAAFKAEMAKADAAYKRGLPLVALLHWEKADRAASYARRDEVERKAGPVAAAVKEDSTCNLSAVDLGMRVSASGDYLTKTREILAKKYPLSAFESSGRCQARFTASYRNERTTKSAGQVVGTSSIEVETEESRKRRHDAGLAQASLERAAERAGRRARQARLDAAVESMKGTAEKMERGRLKVETMGDKKVMTYGSGNWAGSADVATQQKLASNTAAAADLRRQAAAQAPAGAQYKKVDLSMIKQTETTVTVYRSLMELGTEGELAKIEPEPFESSSSRTCVTQERYGALGGGGGGGGCSDTTNFWFLAQKQIEAHFLPTLEIFHGKAAAEHARRGARLAGSKDPSEQLEAALLIAFFGAKGQTPPAAELAAKVLAQPHTPDGLMFSALSF